MPVTFVTCFIKLPEVRSNPDIYLTQFKYLANLKINIHLFLDRRFISTFKSVLDNYKNIFVDYIALEDLNYFKKIEGLELQLPSHRNLTKDHKEFLILMNSKVELVKRAIDKNIFNSTHFSWIDFGLQRIIHNSDTFKLLETIPERKGIYIPGCHQSGPVGVHNVCWRFCGGFFIGDISSILEFYELYEKHFKNIIEANRTLTWEVNIWAMFECYYNWKPTFYLADHNDTIITKYFNIQ